MIVVTAKMSKLKLMTIKQILLSVLVISLSIDFSRSQIACDVHRQQFSILSDDKGTCLGADLLIGEYPTNTSFGSLMINANTEWLTNTPEYLVLRQIKLLSSGDLENVIGDFKPGESREKARKMFADINGLKKFYADIQDFRLLTKAIFGPLTYITYESSLRNGHRATLSAYLEKDGNNYVFVEPKDIEIFNWAASAFPYWKSKVERLISKDDDENLLNATFTYSNEVETNSDFSDSKVIIKYKLTNIAGSTRISESQDPLGVFMRQIIDAYKNDSTNAIISLWRSGRDKMFINGMIQNGEQKETVDYFKKYEDFKINFYISNANQYWVYLTPFLKNDQLKLFRVTKVGDAFKLVAYSDEVFADEILSSKQMTAALMMQVGR